MNDDINNELETTLSPEKTAEKPINKEGLAENNINGENNLKTPSFNGKNTTEGLPLNGENAPDGFSFIGEKEAAGFEQKISEEKYDVNEFEREADEEEKDIPEPTGEEISKKASGEGAAEEKEDRKPSEKRGKPEKSGKKAEKSAFEKNIDKSAEKSAFEKTAENGAEKNDAKRKSVFEDAGAPTAIPEETPASKKRFKTFWKGLKRPIRITIIISALIILLLGFLGIAHAITTKDIIFVHNSEDLFKALEKGKGSVLYIKEDVTVDGDLIFKKGYDINLHGNSLTVNGTVFYDLGSAEEAVAISTLSKKAHAAGGELKASKFVFDGEKADLSVYSKLSAGSVELKAAKNVYIIGSVSGKITLKDMVKNLILFGNAESISGGSKITVVNGAHCALISGAAKVIIQPQARVDLLENVETPVFVEKLEAPKNIMIDSSRALDKILIFTFNKVINADSYIIKIDGDTVVPVTKASGENQGTMSEDGDKITVVYNAEQLVPNDYEVSICAIASENNRERYLDSDAATCKFTVSIQLPEPVIDNIDKENGKLIISFNQYVDRYIVTINNASFTVSDLKKDSNNKISIDISEKIREVGSYSISVVAHSDHSYYSNSNPSYKSCVITKKLDKLIFNTVETDEADNTKTFSWQAVSHAKYYKIKVIRANAEFTEYYTSGLKIVLALNPEEAYTLEFNAVKNGYYLDGDVAVCPVDYVVPAPEEGEAPEE